MRPRLFVSALVALTSLTACDRLDPCGTPPAASASRTPTMSPHEVAALRAAHAEVAIVDVNPRDIFDAGHVPGAIWMDLELDAREALPTDRATPTIFYCYSDACGSSTHAAAKAVAAGWTDVRRMPAGIQGWRAAGLPIETSR